MATHFNDLQAALDILSLGRIQSLSQRQIKLFLVHPFYQQERYKQGLALLARMKQTAFIK